MTKSQSLAFVSKVRTDLAIRIPEDIRDVLNIQAGDYLQVTVEKVEKPESS